MVGHKKSNLGAGQRWLAGSCIITYRSQSQPDPQAKLNRIAENTSLVSRPLPDSPGFSPRLRDKIWEWPGDEARKHQFGVLNWLRNVSKICMGACNVRPPSSLSVSPNHRRWITIYNHACRGDFSAVFWRHGPGFNIWAGVHYVCTSSGLEYSLPHSQALMLPTVRTWECDLIIRSSLIPVPGSPHVDLGMRLLYTHVCIPYLFIRIQIKYNVI